MEMRGKYGLKLLTAILFFLFSLLKIVSNLSNDYIREIISLSSLDFWSMFNITLARIVVSSKVLFTLASLFNLA